jgi:trimeric autotransporter adhesin
MARSRLPLWLFLLLSVLLSALLAGPLAAQAAKQGHDVLSSLAFTSDKFAPSEPIQPLAEAQGQGLVAPNLQNGWAAFLLGANAQWQAVVDGRTGQISLAEGGGIAWVPGRGNGLTNQSIASVLAGRAQPDVAVLDTIARNFLPRVAALLGVNPSTLVLNQARSGQPASHVWFVDYDVVLSGLPVEGARVVFRVNNGNLVQFGTENLPGPGAAVPPTKITRDQAMAAVEAYVGKLQVGDTLIDAGSLHLLPANVNNAPAADGFEPGKGRGLAKVWQITFHRDGVMGTWQARVDAATGELVEFQDINEYAQVTGGAFPISPASGAEAVRAMPFADVATGTFANSAGTFSTGTSSTLSGQFVRIVDTCGAISQATDGSGNIVFGTSAGTDCTTPGHGGAGNTHATRTQYYHVNRIKEVGRGWLPTNTWLGQQLRVNVNLNQTCNAYWNGSTLNFFKSGGGCGNTGEIAAVSLHEYGHGLDANDGSAANGGTGEAYGDVTAAIQLHDSCIGPGFRTSNCGGYGDACTACTGVRDLDFAKHVSNTPATVSNFTQVRCGTGGGPCGREVHCESYVASEAIWDLANRDLPNPGTGSAWTTLDRLWYLSRSTAGAAFACTTGTTFTSNGCNTGSWWKTMRAVDDDNGNLSDGTPHSCNLFAAFNRHGIACTTDAGANTCFRGCTQPAAPTVTLTPGNNSVTVGISGTGVFDVFRNELGCNAGFIKAANDLSATSFTDTGVANGTTYFYQVVAQPSGNEACGSAPSTCLSATPAASTTPDFTVSCAPSSLSAAQGGSATSTCTVSSQNGFNSAVSLSCTGLPAGATCSFATNPVTPPANGSTTSALTVTVASTTATGTTNFQVVGTSGATTHNAALSLTVTPPGPVTVFFDNFETDLGWTRNPNGTDTATTGLWERGNPETTTSGGITTQNGTTPSGVNDLVTAALAGASAGVNDVDGGVTSIQSPPIALPATGTLTLSFARYFAHLNNSTADDFFRVRVVGTTTVTVLNIAGAATNVAATFATTTADISSFRGQTIRILIDVADAGTASLIEAAVDDVKITQQ